MMRRILSALLTLSLLVWAPAFAAWNVVAVGSPVAGVLDSGFDIPITGVQAGETLIGVAWARPSNGITGTYDAVPGYTTIYSHTPDAGSLGAIVFCKIASGSETSASVKTTSAPVSGGGYIIRATGGTCTVNASASLNWGDGNVVDIATPALTVAQANSLILMSAARNWNHDSAGVTSYPATLTNRVAFGSALGFLELSMVAGTKVQTTATNIPAGSIDLVSAEPLVNSVFVISMTAASGSPPTQTTPSAVSARTVNSVSLTQTSACTDCTWYGVALTQGSGAPTCPAIVAGTSAYKTFSAAVTTNVQTTATFSTYTNGAPRDFYECLRSIANGDGVVTSQLVQYKTPGYLVSPVVTLRGEDFHTAASTPDGAGVQYEVSCPIDATAPSGAEVVAGTCASAATPQASGNKSMSGVDTQTVSYAAPRLASSLYFVYRYGGFNSAVQTLTPEIMGGSLGFGAPVKLTSICSDPTCPVKAYNDRYATDIAINDYMSCSSVSQPDGYPLTVDASGQINYGNETIPATKAKQIVYCKMHDISANVMMVDTMPLRVAVNNTSPNCNGTVVAPIKLKFKQGVAITSVDASGQCQDADGDPLVAEATGVPPGLTVSSAGVISGTPSTEVESGAAVTILFRDPEGDAGSSIYNIGTANTLTVGNYAGSPAVNVVTQLQNTGWLTPLVKYRLDPTTPGDTVISQTPAPGEAQPFSTVTLTVSSGTAVRAPTTSGYQITADPTARATIVAVALREHSAAPSCAQAQAHTDGNNNSAMGWGVMTSLNGEQVVVSIPGVTLPKADVHVYSVNAEGVCSERLSQLGVLKSAAAGRRYSFKEL